MPWAHVREIVLLEAQFAVEVALELDLALALVVLLHQLSSLCMVLVKPWSSSNWLAPTRV
jgi:hypothetical protein